MSDAVRSLPSSIRIVQPARVGHFTERSFAAIAPGELSSILKAAERGTLLERYADMVEWICEDDRISSVLDTRIDSVVSLPFEVKPGLALPGQERAANLAADFCKIMIDETNHRSEIFEDLLHAYMLGYSAAEHVWEREGGFWVSQPKTIRPRDIDFARDWSFRFRTYSDSPAYQWIDAIDYPDKFMTFAQRRRGSTPLRSGVVRSCVWYWLFKRWALKFWVAGAERLGTPPMIGKFSRETNAVARDALKAGLENLSEGQAALLEENTGIEFPDTKFAQSADVWEKLVKKCDDGITLSVLGSLDLVDGGPGGSKARAETQAEWTIEPRIGKLALRLYEVIERDWFAPFLKFNADKFGGMIPPTPRMIPADNEIKKIEPIYQYHLAGRLVKRNEVRAQLGLESLPDEMGGEELLDLQTAGSAGAEVPLAANRPQAATTNLLPQPTNTPSTAMSLGLTQNAALSLGLSLDAPASSSSKRKSTGRVSSRTSKTKR